MSQTPVSVELEEIKAQLLQGLQDLRTGSIKPGELKRRVRRTRTRLEAVRHRSAAVLESKEAA